MTAAGEVGAALVTGITGQDGGYLAEQLAQEGRAVHGTVRPGERTPDHLTALGDAVTLHEVDLADEQALAGSSSRWRPTRCSTWPASPRWPSPGGSPS